MGTNGGMKSSAKLDGPMLLLAISLVALFAAYWGGLEEVVTRWIQQEEYSHGFFIPLITLWMLWKRKDAILESLGASSWSGVIMICVGLLGLFLGELTAIFILIQLGFLVSLMGLLLAFGGLSLLRVAFVPVAFLIFAIPLPYFIDSKLSAGMQLLSSQIGVSFLRMVGSSVFLEGNVIDLGEYKLQVVEACSGLRYLYPLMSIGFLVGYMYRSVLWQKWVIFFSAIPVTILMNSVRIAIVGLLVERWGSGMADGFLHYFEGWVVFMLCLAVLMGEIWLFERWGSHRRVMDCLDVPVTTAVIPANPRQTGINVSLVASIILLMVAVVGVQVLNVREETHPQRTSLTMFPLTLGQWKAEEIGLSKQVESALGLDDYVLADYHHPVEGGINFYTAYYGSQRKGVSPHSPQVCMPGGGWVITLIERVLVKLQSEQPFEVNRVLIEREGKRQLVYYWFEQRGRRIANEYLVKWYLFVDALTRNRTDGALVRITTPVAQGDDGEMADSRLRHFMEVAIPQLPAYVPK
jgi:exosortase D (VPLPA-CTERM-specific)